MAVYFLTCACTFYLYLIMVVFSTAASSAPRLPCACEAPATGIFLMFWNLPWSFQPSGPLYLLFLLLENMPLKIRFFHLFCHLSSTEFLNVCLKAECTRTSQRCKKADVVPALMESTREDRH